MKKLLVTLAILIVFAMVWQTLTPSSQKNINSNKASESKVEILKEENLVVDVVRNVGPSVVTISIELSPNLSRQDLFLGPFSIFLDEPQVTPREEKTEKSIGSGFILTKNGMIATNKHVVSNLDSKYLVIDEKGSKYEVENIYRDPLNDLAILKTKTIPAGGFRQISLGDSESLQVGQFVIAIGTALGEFRNTVTTGVVSGLGRGITAGSPFEGFAERLDDVIQTDAAINPGNSGGPLLNSKGQVIGVNTAVSLSGQNIGFAIPINIVKESLKNFNDTGQFNRPYLGVSYAMLTPKAAALNSLPEGAYVQNVIPSSGADKGGVRIGDVITQVDGVKLANDNGGLAAVIAKKKVGDSIILTIYNNGETKDIKVTLEKSPEEK